VTRASPGLANAHPATASPTLRQLPQFSRVLVLFQPAAQADSVTAGRPSPSPASLEGPCAS